MLTYWETLTAIQSNVPVNDSYARLWGRKSQGGYTVVTYTGTLPATLTGTKAGYLHRYKIYGNTVQNGTPTPENPIVPQECGERTENQFDVEEITHNGYSKNNFYGQVSSNNICAVIKRFEPNTDYCITWEFSSTSEVGVHNQMRLYAGTSLIGYVNSGAVINFTQEQIDSITNVIAYFGTGNTDGFYKNFTIVQRSTAPESYIPYGYKLPLTSAGQGIDIYIGDDTISAEEYVDSGTGKIYRMVGGVLTPVDPPVPLPQIPTSAGSTTISWAGEGLAPSQVELEYEKKG